MKDLNELYEYSLVIEPRSKIQEKETTNQAMNSLLKLAKKLAK